MKSLSTSSAFLMALLFIPTLSYSAGFDCKKATTKVEKFICASDELSKLDELMTVVYKKKLIDSEDMAKYLKKEQHQWLKHHRNTCDSMGCLQREYKEYLKLADGEELKISEPAVMLDIPLTDNKFGTFQNKKEISVYQGEKEGWQEEKATDTITIDKINNNNNLALLNIDIIATNAHTCSIENQVVNWSENHWKWNDFDNENSCELRIYPSKNTVLLQDINHQCRKTLCGARAGFDGLILKKIN